MFCKVLLVFCYFRTLNVIIVSNDSGHEGTLMCGRAVGLVYSPDSCGYAYIYIHIS